MKNNLMNTTMQGKVQTDGIVPLMEKCYTSVYVTFRGFILHHSGANIITNNNFNAVSFVMDPDAFGCMDNNYWEDSHWNLQNGISSCFYKSIFHTKSDKCPIFIGVLV